jgi:hypothetical protein
MAALCKLLVEEWITDHNLTGHDGTPLPVGPGLFDALGFWPGMMLLDQRGGFEACRRAAKQRRLWQPVE